MKNYGIYSVDGKKLPNSDKILGETDRFWGNLTKRVFDSTPNNVFGIVLHPMWIDDEVYWIVRESKKWRLDTAKLFCKNLFRNGYE